MISKSEKAKVEIFNSNSWDVKLISSPLAESSYQGFNSNTDKVRKKELNKGLSRGQHSAIASAIRRCYSQDLLAKNYRLYVASMVVIVDKSGIAKIVKFDTATHAKINSDPAYRAFTEHARQAALNPA